MFCFSLQLFAQDNTNRLLKGVIYDSNSQQPLMYATVFVLNSNTGVISNEQGQYAIDISMQVRTQQSFECLLLSHEDISPSDYHHFEQSKKMKVIYVDQFDDSLWQGYDILEPTQQMREYKKPVYD